MIRTSIVLLGLAAGWFGAAGCGLDTGGADGGSCTPPCGAAAAPGGTAGAGGGAGGGAVGGGGDSGGHDVVLDLDVPETDAPSPDAAPPLHAVCAEGCRPDDPLACGPDAGAPEDAKGTFGCVPGAEGATCQAVGQGLSGAPCLGAADCAPGLGCVGDEGASRCRRFCCTGNEGCPESGTWCVERPLRVAGATRPSTTPVRAPVCMPAEGCSLADPWPCPSTALCSCPDGTACSVVRADGSTACVVPGAGRTGEPCPCAAGHLCSQATGRCLPLCRLAASARECGSGVCQLTPGLPEGWGLCAGVTGGDGG